MTKTITFNELRRLKDSLPDGSTHRIADELGISQIGFWHFNSVDPQMWDTAAKWQKK
jgi:hypothetical protein